MDNVSGIEPFLVEFFDWYAPFLERARALKLHDRVSEGTEIAGFAPLFVVEDRGLYRTEDFSLDGKLRQGMVPAISELEKELKVQVQELERRHHCGATLFFKVLNGFSFAGFTNPHYDLFVTALEFSPQRDSAQKAAAYLRYGDSLGCFDACYDLQSCFNMFFNIPPVVPGVKMPEAYNDRWRGFNHPEGADRGHIMYNVSGDYDGNFFFRDGRQFDFYVGYDENSGSYVLDSTVTISRVSLGLGVLTSFLEMLDANNRN